MFDRICQRSEEAKQRFDLVITTYEELEMCTEESVWKSHYGGKMAEIEGHYSRMKAAISGVSVEYGTFCAKQEKQKKVEQAAVVAAAGGGAEQEKQKKVEQTAAASAAGGGAGAVGGGAAVGGIKYRAEMALCPETLAVDSTGLEYCAQTAGDRPGCRPEQLMIAGEWAVAH